MLKALTPACVGIVVVLLRLAPGGPAGPGVEIELAAAGQDREFVPITDEMLRDPDPADWLMAYRTYDFQGFSPLDQITRENVGQLRLAWMRAMDEGDQEIRPLVYDGVMYIANPVPITSRPSMPPPVTSSGTSSASCPTTCASTRGSAGARATWRCTATTSTT